MSNAIVVPIDGSKNSLQALNEAKTLAKDLNGKVYIINVQPSFDTIHTRMFISKIDIQKYQSDLASEALEAAKEIIQEDGIDYEIVLKIGVPKHEIATFAKEINAKYIVIGSRGMGPVKGQVLGSVSYGVLHEATCPVIIVPANK